LPLAIDCLRGAARPPEIPYSPEHGFHAIHAAAKKAENRTVTNEQGKEQYGDASASAASMKEDIEKPIANDMKCEEGKAGIFD